MTVETIMQEALQVKATMDLLVAGWTPDSEGDSMGDGSDDQGWE